MEKNLQEQQLQFNMSDVLDHNLKIMIYHNLHKNLANLEDLTDYDIKMMLIKIFKEILPDVEIEIIDKNKIAMIKDKKRIEISLQKWVDDLKILYNNYSPYLFNGLNENIQNKG